MYNLVVCGGTFDHLHKGHKAFLRFVLSQGKKILLGLTMDNFVRIRKTGDIQPYSVRFTTLNNFFLTEHAIDRVTIAPIDSSLYPSTWSKLPIEAIVTTIDTYSGGLEINKYRKQQGITQLPIIVMPLVSGEDGGELSSTRIRLGEIDTQGNRFKTILSGKNFLSLPEDLRQVFHMPFGTLYPGGNIDLPALDPQTTITVGDAVTKHFCSKIFVPRLSLVDLKTKRKYIAENIYELGLPHDVFLLQAINPTGKITLSLLQAIEKATAAFTAQKYITIFVDGEEDLAVLPLVLLLPLGFTIFYGQPDEGIVKLTITLEAKNAAYEYIKKFTFF